MEAKKEEQDLSTLQILGLFYQIDFYKWIPFVTVQVLSTTVSSSYPFIFEILTFTWPPEFLLLPYLDLGDFLGSSPIIRVNQKLRNDPELD